jgi:predicted aspartyl protease
MGRLFRAVTLRNGRQSLQIVAFIDSGSDTTIISQRSAKKLHLKPFGEDGIELPDGRVIPTSVGKVLIEVERDNIKKLFRVDITDLPFNEDIDDVDMIIGVDLLQECDVKIHFQGQTTRKAKKGPVWRAPAASTK